MCPCKDKQSPKDHSTITVCIPLDFLWLFNGMVNRSDYIPLMITWCLMKNWKIQTVHFIVSLKTVLSHPTGHPVAAAVFMDVLLLHMRSAVFTISCNRNNMQFPLFIASVIFVCNQITRGR